MARIEYSWERLPEILAAQEYHQCLGRLVASLPDPVAYRATAPLADAALQLAIGLVGCNLDVPPGHEDLSAEERAEYRRCALDALRESRRRIERLRKRRHGDQDEIVRALELLDRTEMWITAPTAEATH
jgi:hypothetical protein